MRVARMTTVLVIAMIAAMAFGCATTPGSISTEKAETKAGPTPEEDARAALADALAALKEGDIEETMAAISDDYSNSESADKSAARMGLEGSVAQGVFAGLVVNMEKCKIAVEGDTAIAGPVIFESPMGNSAQEYRMKKEGDGVWRIVSSEQIFPPAVDIWSAALMGDIEAIKQHVSAGTDLNAKEPGGSTPLHISALVGKPEAARLLIENGAPIDAISNDGGTALHMAAAFGHTELVKLLLEEGADINIRNYNSLTPLDTVAPPWSPELEGLYRYFEGLLQIELDLEKIRAARPEIAAILRKHIGRSEKTKDDIWSAAAIGDIKAIRRHLSAGTDPNVMNPILGLAPLQVSAIYGQAGTARLLIEGGADMNATSREGSTALHTAAFFGHTEIVKLLLKKGADTSIRDQLWQTPLESLSAPWDSKLEGLYRYLEGALKLKLDIESIKAVRPKIADLLRQHGG